MSGEYAWDEDIPGAEIVAGKGKATPRPDALQERLIRLWASPHGAPKAAIAGAAGLPPSESFGQSPAVLIDRQTTAGAKATPTLSNGKPDLSGSWQGAGGGQQGSGGDMFRRCTPFQSKNCMEWTNQSEDWPFMSATRLDQRQPLYKPEYWDKIIELDQWTNK